FTAPAGVQTLEFELTVSDGKGGSHVDSVIVHVLEDRANALFVDGDAGSDTSGNGSMASPYASVRHALTQVGSTRGDLYLRSRAGGAAYEEANATLAVPSGTSLYGGYGANWERDPAARKAELRTNSQGLQYSGLQHDVWVSGLDVRAAGSADASGNAYALRVAGNGQASVTIEHNRLVAGDVAAGTAATPGSSYGVLLSSLAGAVVFDNEIAAGQGGSGSAGNSGSPGGRGNDGADGNRTGGRQAAGGSGPGGAGGVGGTRGGGLGGSGGDGGGGGNGNAPLGGVILGGGGGSGGNPGNVGSPGGSGGRGLPGSGGLGRGGNSSEVFVASNGTNGGTGGAGSGGGGGGGGNANAFGTVGGGGGGGGAGGGGGGGGVGGRGAGASVGLWLHAVAQSEVEDNVIAAGAGGNGGAGGAGGSGGGAGSGGAGVDAGSPGPEVAWLRGVHGPGGQRVTGVYRTGGGGVIVGGNYSKGLQLGALTGTNAGNSDVFVARLTADGSPEWLNTFGGAGDDYLTAALAVDGSGQIYAGGMFKDAPLTFGPHTLTPTDSSWDAFVVRFSNAGTPTSAFRLGGPDTQALRGRVALHGGAPIFGGHFGTSVAVAGTTLTSKGSEDGLITRLYSSTSDWAFSYGDANKQLVWDLHSNGSLIAFTGDAFGSFTFGSSTVTSAGESDVLLAVLDGTGAPVFAKRFGDGQSQVGRGVFVTSDSIYLTGEFRGVLNMDGKEVTSKGETDLFVSRHDHAGHCQWLRSFGASLDDRGERVHVSAGGAVYVLGTFQDAVDFGGGMVTSQDRDVILVRLTKDGDFVWAVPMGGPGNDEGHHLSEASNGNLLVAGAYPLQLSVLGQSLGKPPPTDGDMDGFVLSLVP
ncbi:MAG: hypothetical protein KF718_23420, partial [Polyangiaceae bacterium]|nr:hypothetical protein [Polyangiaceae bacterium]